MKRDAEPPKRIERWPISDRVKYVQERLTQYAPLPIELEPLPGLLDYIGELLERRNEVIHGRIYGGMQGK